MSFFYILCIIRMPNIVSMKKEIKDIIHKNTLGGNAKKSKRASIRSPLVKAKKPVVKKPVVKKPIVKKPIGFVSKLSIVNGVVKRTQHPIYNTKEANKIVSGIRKEFEKRYHPFF